MPRLSYLIAFVSALLPVPPVAASDCLKVVDSGFMVDKSEEGAGELDWHALIENQCDRDQDAILTVEFLDEAEKSIYQVQDQLIVERKGQTQAGRRVHAPAGHLDAIKSLVIQVEARERPF